MDRQLTPNEIETAVTTARITSPVITEEEYPPVVGLHRRLKELGYLEAVRGLTLMERELGIPVAEAVARYQELVAKVPELAAQEARARESKSEADRAATESQKRGEGEKEAADRAQSEHERLQRELAAYAEEARRERERLDADVRMAREKADMDKAEIAIASELKRQLETRGLRLAFVLDLVQAVPDDEGARERLAAAIEEYDTLYGAITAMREEKASTEEEVTVLQEKKAGLGDSCRGLKEELARLRADVAEEKRLRAFHEKFKDVAPLMEYIQSWKPLAFLRIRFLMSPTYRVLTRDGTPVPSPFGTAAKWEWDLEAYQALNLPPGPVSFG